MSVTLPCVSIVSAADIKAWGWSSEKLLDVLIALDYEVFDGLTPEAEGMREQWVPVFVRSPHSCRFLTNGEKEIVGYWHFVALDPASYSRARTGQLMDGEIRPEFLLPLSTPGAYDIYIVSFCLRSGYRRGMPTALLLGSFFDVFSELAEQGIFIREMCTNAYTSEGIAFVSRLGFRPVGAHSDQGTVYGADFAEWLRVSPLAMKHARLQRAYLNLKDGGCGGD